MPIISNGPGAIQTAYVGYRTLDIGDGVTLFWPNAGQATENVMAAFLNITVGNIGATVTLPDARQVSVGQNFIIQNTSIIEEFSLKDNAGGDLGPIYNGTQPDPANVNAFYYVLRDNSTQAGTWIRVAFGATISAPVASELAGPGLTAIGGLLYTNSPTTIVNDATLNINTSTQNANVFVWNTGAGFINLDPAGDEDIDNGFYFYLNNYDGQGAILISPVNGTKTVDGQINKTINPGQSLMLFMDGSQNWWSIGYSNASTNVFSAIDVVLVSGTVTLNPTQYGNNLLRLTGALTGNVNLIFPNITDQWEVVNETSNAFTVTAKLTGNLSPVVIPQGQSVILYSYANTLKTIPTVVAAVPTFPDGNAVGPGIHFTDDANSGFYQLATGQVALSCATAPVWQATHNSFNVSVASQMLTLQATGITTNALTINGSQFIAPTGASANVPGIGFLGDTSTGFFRSAASTITVVCNGTPVAVFNEAAFAETIIQDLLQVNGNLHVTGAVVLTTALPIAQGGTGATTQAAAKNALLGTPLTGSLLYYNGTTWVALAPGANGTTLKMAGGIPTWTP